MSITMQEALLSGNEYIAEIELESLDVRITQTDIDRWNAGGGTGGVAPNYTFELRLDGNLYVVYPDDATAPNFSINANGELIYNT